MRNNLRTILSAGQVLDEAVRGMGVERGVYGRGAFLTQSLVNPQKAHYIQIYQDDDEVRRSGALWLILNHLVFNLKSPL